MTKKAAFPPSPHSSPQKEERILQVKGKWLDLIRKGEKRIEVRGTSAELGPLWLGEKGYIKAWARIVRVERVLNIDQFQSRERYHCVVVADTTLPYNRTHFWHLEEVFALPTAVQYKVKTGPVVWTRFAVADSAKSNAAHLPTRCGRSKKSSSRTRV